MRWNFRTDEERRMELIDFLKMYMGSLTTCLDKIARLPCYTAEEQIRIREQIIDIMQTMYPARDYLSQGAILGSEYYMIASLYVGLGKHENALSALEKAGEQFNYCDSHDGTHVSLAFRGCNRGRMHTDERSYRGEFLEMLCRDSTFDPLRENPRYTEILNQLNTSQSGEDRS